MSARAITPDLLLKMWQSMVSSENWVIRPYTPGSHNNGRNQAKTWKAGGRLLRALWACYTIAFSCLLRFDEVLRIRVEDLEVESSTVIILTLRWRKTAQFGGMQPFIPCCLFPYGPFQGLSLLFSTICPMTKHISVPFAPLQNGLLHLTSQLDTCFEKYLLIGSLLMMHRW
jgi:hypothetical protein